MRFALTLEKLDLQRGGAEVATYRLLRELSERGHEVDLFTTGCAVELPPRCRLQTVTVPWDFVALRQLSFARQIEQALGAGRYDLTLAAAGRGSCEDALWAQNGSHRGASAGKVRGYYYNPLVRALRQFQDFYNIRTYVYRRLEAKHFARRPAPFVIAPSQMIANQFLTDYRLPAERIRVIAYQVDLDRFSPEAMRTRRPHARSAFNVPASSLAILCVAQNFRRKGVRPLIEAAALLRAAAQPLDFVVLVAGSTEREAVPYRRLARRLGVGERIHFLGQCRRMEDAYAAADVFCLPTFADPCAIATIEAMACGLPVVTSRYNGAHELIEHGVSGMIVQEPEDVRELAAALHAALTPPARASLGQAGATVARQLCNNPRQQIAVIVEDLAEHKRREQMEGPDHGVDA
jgi:UDP-glucose:(heptosyl)LPS alpha-1,3-glucosyltransferase